ncbi:hypothetical protein EZV62_009706 [Acer yangbiense]|uniref:EF-hand domain-containing protein n=1 Tax=Acer yangbiense TaxID=1000413 RepID=A0A5C7I2Q7_9ROSI|nr:hypothetical protein EZV62_009706 [Acer yangbiense]
MTGSFKTCWMKIRLFFLEQLKTSYESSRSSTRRRKHNSFDLLVNNSSFAAMELSNQFKQVFKVIDSNGDGKISTLEISEVLLCLGGYDDKSKATKDAQSMVTQMDYNGDGFIDLDEFMDAVHHVHGSKEEDCDNHLMDAFLIFDSDKNGLISAKELRRVLISLGSSKCSLHECKRMIKGVDKDGDGFVDFQEFRSMMMTTQNSIHHQHI